MYRVQPIFPSVGMWQRVLRIRACMYQDEQQENSPGEAHKDTDKPPTVDLHEQLSSWKLWMARINDAQLLLKSTGQERNLPEAMGHVLEALLDIEEWESFDKFKDNDNVFNDR